MRQPTATQKESRLKNVATNGQNHCSSLTLFHSGHAVVVNQLRWNGQCATIGKTVNALTAQQVPARRRLQEHVPCLAGSTALLAPHNTTKAYA